MINEWKVPLKKGTTYNMEAPKFHVQLSFQKNVFLKLYFGLC